MKQNETEKNPEELEQVNGGDINDIVRNFNMREQMKKDYLEGECMRFSEMLERRKNEGK